MYVMKYIKINFSYSDQNACLPSCPPPTPYLLTPNFNSFQFYIFCCNFCLKILTIREYMYIYEH